MKAQEAAQRLDQIAQGFNDATKQLEDIYNSLKLTQSYAVPTAAPQCTKQAASAAIVAPIERLMVEAANPDLIAVAVQLAKIGGKVRIALPGGAVLSKQEQDWIQDPNNASAPPPPNLFYVLAQQQLQEDNRLHFDYNATPYDTGFEASLRKNLLRELGEELGKEASEHVTVGAFFPGNRLTTLATLKLPDLHVAKAIATALEQVGVRITEDGTLTGIYTTVQERVAVAHAPLDLVQRAATENSEAKGMRVRTLGDLLKVAQRTAESQETYLNYRETFGTSSDCDGIRNPSTTWGLALLTTWIRDQVVNNDSTSGVHPRC